MDNQFNSHNWHKKHCFTQIIGDAYFVTLSDVPTTIFGVQIPMPTFAPNSYKNVCVFNNTDKIVEVSYNTEDGNSYIFKLVSGENYTHTSDAFIVNNSVTIKSLNGSVSYGQVDFYFNYLTIPTTTTNTSTSSTSTSSTSSSSTSTSTSTSTTTTTLPLYPGSIATPAGWDSTALLQRAIVYLPYGYNPANAKLYPWALYLHSEFDYGTSSGVSGIERLYRSGPPKYLKEGDTPIEFIIICPQISAGSWTNTKIEAARNWAIANYKVDSTKLCLTGTSIGGTGIANYVAAFPNRISSYAIGSGSLTGLANAGTAISGIRPADIQGLFIGGNQDNIVSPVTAINYIEDANGLTPKPLYPFLFESIHGGVHNRVVWDENLYNRLYRTDSKGNARIDWIEDIAKNYKTVDYIFNATRKVEIAETGLDLNKYFEALHATNNLTSSSSKVALQSRLSLVENNINNYNRNFILSFGSTPAINGVYNNIPTPSLSVSPSLKDTNGQSSAYTFTVTSMNWTTTPSVDVHLDNFYLGFDESFHATAFRCFGMNNIFRLSGLKPDKAYNIRLYFADNNPTNITKNGGFVTVNSIVKESLNPSFNTHRYLDFNELSTSSGIIDIIISAYSSSSYLDVTGLLLTELLNS